MTEPMACGVGVGGCYARSKCSCVSHRRLLYPVPTLVVPWRILYSGIVRWGLGYLAVAICRRPVYRLPIFRWGSSLRPCCSYICGWPILLSRHPACLSSSSLACSLDFSHGCVAGEQCERGHTLTI